MLIYIYIVRIKFQTYSDTLALSRLFQTLKAKSVNPQGLRSSRGGGQAGITVKPVSGRAKKTKADLPVAPCAHCEETFEVVGWPDSVALPKQVDGPTSTTAVPSGDWQWVCPQCVLDKGAELIDKKVQVWWQDDAQYYQGVVRAYDAVSQRHCVLYDDRQWEYINLGTEPVLLSQSKIKNSSVTSKQSGKSGRNN